MDTPVNQQYAFITPKEGIYGKPFENMDNFEFVPNTGLDMSKIEGKTKVKDILDNAILDQDRYKGVGNMTVEIDDSIPTSGQFDPKTNTIKIKSDATEKVLYEEIQHAVDKKSGTNKMKKLESISDAAKPHDMRKIEEVTNTNNILYDAEKMIKAGKSKKEVIKYFDDFINKAKKVNTTEAKKSLQQYKNAKTLFQRALDEGKILIA